MSISPDPNSLVTGLYLQIRACESALASERQQNAEHVAAIKIIQGVNESFTKMNDEFDRQNIELRRERDEARLDAGLLREKLKWLLDELHDREDITSNGQANIAMGVLAEFKEKFHEQ